MCLFYSFCVFALCIIQPLLANTNSNSCFDLPRQCTINDDDQYHTQIVFDLNDDKIVFSSKRDNKTDSTTNVKRCNEKYEKLNLIVFLNKPWFKHIIGQNFDFNNLLAFINVNCGLLKMCSIEYLAFSFLDGFELRENSIYSLSKNNLDLNQISYTVFLFISLNSFSI